MDGCKRKCNAVNDERLDATKDQELKDVIRHNRDDEKEHFSLLLEFLRRNDPELDRESLLLLLVRQE